MDWAGRIRAALVTATQSPDEDVVAELAEHAAAAYSDALAQGASPDEAASRVMKDIEQWRIDAAGLKRKHDRAVQVEPPPVDGSSWVAGLVHDLRYALRLQRRQIKFAALVIGLTALGIGATAALFSVTYDVLVKPLPWPNADRVVSLTETRGGNTARVGGFTNVVYLAWQEDARTVDGLAAWSLGLAPWSPGLVTLTGDGNPERITTVSATASLFSVLGVQPLLGSLFVAEQETERVVVLSEGLWRRRFAADANIVGRLVSLDGQPYSVVGVVAEAAIFPDRRTQAFVPLRVPNTPNGLLVFSALALPRPGTSLQQVGSEGTVRGAAAPNPELTSTGMFGRSGPVAVTATPLVDSLTGTVKTPLLVLLAAVALLLAAATANVANLQLARAMTRSRELALRAALGAGRARIYRQVLIENLSSRARRRRTRRGWSPGACTGHCRRCCQPPFRERTISPRPRRRRARAVARRRGWHRLHPRPRRRLAAPRSARGSRRGRRRIGRCHAGFPDRPYAAIHHGRASRHRLRPARRRIPSRAQLRGAARCGPRFRSVARARREPRDAGVGLHPGAAHGGARRNPRAPRRRSRDARRGVHVRVADRAGQRDRLVRHAVARG